MLARYTIDDGDERTYIPTTLLSRVGWDFEATPIAANLENTSFRPAALGHRSIPIPTAAIDQSHRSRTTTLVITGRRTIIDIKAIRRIRLGAIPRNRHRTLRFQIPSRLHIHLRTRNIVLRIPILRLVQCQQFRPHKIVTPSQSLGQIDGEQSTTLLRHLDSAPLVRVAHIPEFEPAVASGTVGHGICNFLEVDGARADVAGFEGGGVLVVGGFVVFEGEGGAIGNGADTTDAGSAAEAGFF